MVSVLAVAATNCTRTRATGDYSWIPFVLPCLVIKTRGKLQLSPNRVINSSDTLRVEFQVTLQGKELANLGA